MSRRREALVKWTMFALVCALWTGVIVACGNQQSQDTPPAGDDTPEPTKEPPPPEPTKEPPPPPPPPPEPVADGGAAAADGGATPAADGGTVACGRPGQPMCPMQEYMKRTMLPAMRSGQGIEESFTKVAGWAPDPAYEQGEHGWRATAEAGAAAIKAGNKAAAQATCKACHTAWQKRYRAEFRPRPIPTP